MCGEHPKRSTLSCHTAGSSPRVRGTPCAANSPPPHGGIIPACAGNTGRPHSPLAATGDHPRVCGEHVAVYVPVVPFGGSSPRVRGTQGAKVGRFAVVGIIPACAGNTSAGAMPVPSRTDHPRVCGEHPAMVCTTPAAPGSSPRVRGTHLLICDCVRVRGIIPACAGNTMPMFSPWRKPRDHPRVCGEHDIQLTVTQCAPGSSPRVRGTL